MTPWRDLHELFPGVGVEQACGGSLSSLPPAGLLGAGAPAAVSAPPAAAATPSCVAADAVAGIPAQRPAHHACGMPAAPSRCAWVSGCDGEATDRLTGFCEPHADWWRDEVREYTDDIGRGSWEG